ncbi:hypothetical protein [Mesorhizobium sp. KR9-304]|uniref:hypothetical protein n=1 Tax=Mesorhizobium sp. KR9-304 TaxID=3156614 RepID=UPI0032B46CF1
MSVAHAGESAPFIYLATQDPFVSPEAPNAKDDIHVFSGVFAGGSFGSVVQFWDTDYTDNFMIGGIYGRDLKDLGTQRAVRQLVLLVMAGELRN